MLQLQEINLHLLEIGDIISETEESLVIQKNYKIFQSYVKCDLL